MVLAPLLLTCCAAVLTIYLARGRGKALSQPAVPTVLLVAQIATVPLAWILIRTAPDIVSSYHGAACKDVVDAEAIFFPLILGSALLGGLAWGTLGRQSDSSLGHLFVYAAVAICIPYGIGIWWFLEVACSTWN